MEAHEKQLLHSLRIELLDPAGNVIEGRLVEGIVSGWPSLTVMRDIDATTRYPMHALNVIAIDHGKLCVNCDGVEGNGYGDCPIYWRMEEAFGGTPEDSFCPFFAAGERLPEEDEDESQESSEPISEPSADAISETISGQDSGAETEPQIPEEKWTDNWCKRCGAEVQPSRLTGRRLFYNVEVLSERHLCADCVLDLMRTDPTCEDVMQYVLREAQ